MIAIARGDIDFQSEDQTIESVIDWIAFVLRDLQGIVAIKQRRDAVSGLQ